MSHVTFNISIAFIVRFAFCMSLKLLCGSLTHPSNILPLEPLNYLTHNGFNKNDFIAGKRIQRSHDHTGLGRPAVHHFVQGS